MAVLNALSLIVAPALFWLLYHRYKDRHQAEPLLYLGIAYLLGIGAGLLCFRFYDFTGIQGNPDGEMLTYLFYCVVWVGLVEELAKLLPFWLVCVRFESFDEPIDGIIYASVVALGFASYENFMYMKFLDGAAMLGRAIASPLTHCMFASIWGYAVGRARIEGRAILGPMLLGLIVAAVSHGVYDFFVTALHPYLRPATAGIILTIWIWRMRLIDQLRRDHSSGG